MAYQLDAPVERTFILDQLDPTGEAKITFRQARARENQVRDRMVFGEQARTFTANGLQLQGTVTWSEREELECKLTMVGCESILDEEGEPLFRFREDGKLAMNDTQFHKSWGKLPPHVATMFHLCCLDTNPEWDFRDDPNSARERDDE